MQEAAAYAQQDSKNFPVRQIPYSLDAEKALLGALLINNKAYDKVSDFLCEKHFYNAFHGQLYRSIGQLISQGKSAEYITVKTYLPKDLLIEEISCDKYVAYLQAEAVTIINTADYAKVIYDLYLRRCLVEVGESIINAAYDTPIDYPPQKQIEDAEKKLFNLGEKGNLSGGFEEFYKVLTKSIKIAETAKKRSNKLSGISTGIKSLDDKIGGLQRSDLIVLAGRPGMGKTSLATNVAFNIARAYKSPNSISDKAENHGGIVGFFSLEMSVEQLATRIIAEQAGISSSKIRRGEISDYEFPDLIRCAQNIQNIPLYIDPTGGISIAQLAGRARRLKRQHGLDVLLIDYVQLISYEDSSINNRVQEITRITTSLKALAKELDVPIIALSQLSRQVEYRPDRRPQLSDLRESGSIEQDADIVLFVYREEYYLINKQPVVEGTKEHNDWSAQWEAARGKAEVIVAKQRHGSTGIIQLAFNDKYTRFSDFADPAYYPERHNVRITKK